MMNMLASDLCYMHDPMTVCLIDWLKLCWPIATLPPGCQAKVWWISVFFLVDKSKGDKGADKNQWPLFVYLTIQEGRVWGFQCVLLQRHLMHKKNSDVVKIHRQERSLWYPRCWGKAFAPSTMYCNDSAPKLRGFLPFFLNLLAMLSLFLSFLPPSLSLFLFLSLKSGL